MGQYLSFCLSNYFHVKDPAQFEDLMEQMGVTVETDDDGRVTMFVEDDDGCSMWPAELFDEETEESTDIDFVSLIASHIVEGDVAILMSAGLEFSRSVDGYAIAVNSANERREIALHDIYELATELGNNATEAEY